MNPKHAAVKLLMTTNQNHDHDHRTVRLLTEVMENKVNYDARHTLIEDMKSHSLILNETDLSRPNKPKMEGPKTAAEEMQMMRKLYNEMVMEKAGIKGDNLIQIGGMKKNAEKELAVAE